MRFTQGMAKKTGMKSWSLYIIRCANGNLYTGVTTDVKRRFQEHGGTSGKGAKALRGKGPFDLVLKRKIGSVSLALRVEHGIKQLPRADKLKLLRSRSAMNTFVRSYIT